MDFVGVESTAVHQRRKTS